MTALRATWFEDLVVVPRHACLYDTAGRRVDGTVHLRNGRAVRRTPERVELPRITDRIREPVVYGGHLPKHFGHFLLESLVRTWVYPMLRPGPLPFVHFREKFHLHEEDLLDAALRPYGAAPQAVLGPTLLQSVLVPEQGAEFDHIVQDEMRAVYDGIRDTLAGRDLPASDTPLYLSRSRLGRDHRSTLGERSLERRLAQEGIDVIHPQELPLAEQIAAVSAARTVVGLHGTALHLTLFRDLERSRTLALGPRRAHRPQVTIDRFRGAQHRHLHVTWPLHPRLPGLFGGRALELGPYRDLVLPHPAARRVLRAL